MTLTNYLIPEEHTVIWVNKRGNQPCSCCGTWENHWMRNAKKKELGVCAVKGCVNPADVGGHVYREGKSQDGYTIVPLCSSHNQMEHDNAKFELKANIKRVPEMETPSCGYGEWWE